MWLTINQLRSFVPKTSSVPRVVDTLVELGHEVESVQECTELGPDAVCASIVSKKAHPNAKHLAIYGVKVSGKPFTIVSDRVRLSVGSSVAAILAGGKLDGRRINEREIFSVISQGVFCDARSLGLPQATWRSHSDDVWRLYPDGCDGRLDEILGLPDVVLDVKPTPNRGDCLSVLGLARELLARHGYDWSQGRWSPDPENLTQWLRRSRTLAQNETVAEGSVPLGSVTGAHFYALSTFEVADDSDWSNRPSPSWLQEELIRFEQRPISLLVDLTNYYLFVYGQPMHIFDADKIIGAVDVRSSRRGECFSTLDHRKIELRAGELVVADQENIIALAGIYGGDRAEIDSGTRRIAVECASFESKAVRGRPQRYQLNTESSVRYERGVDRRIGGEVLADFTRLLHDLLPQARTLGTVASINEEPGHHICLSVDRLERYLGFAPDITEVKNVLSRLGLHPQANDDERLIIVSVPSWRSDVRYDVCLIEELLRMGWLKDVPAQPKFSGAQNQNQSLLEFDRQFSDIQNARVDYITRGFNEVCSYSFISSADDQAFFASESVPAPHYTGCFGTTYPSEEVRDAAQLGGKVNDAAEERAVSVVNPISADMNVLQRSQIPSLCRLVHYHHNRQMKDLRLFECGSVFFQTPKGVKQVSVVSGVLSGRASPEQWGQSNRAITFFDLKGILQDHFRLLLPRQNLQFSPAPHRFTNLSQSVEIRLNDRIYGFFGQLSSSLQAYLEINAEVWVFEYDSSVYNTRIALRRAQTPARVPFIRRDLSLVLPNKVSYRQLKSVIESRRITDLRKFAIFDLYSGKNIESDFKSISLLLIFRQKSTNLLESEVDKNCQELVRFLSDSLGARLRS